MSWTIFFHGQSTGGHINGQNSRIWSTENKHTLHGNPLHPQRFILGVQCLENEL